MAIYRKRRIHDIRWACSALANSWGLRVRFDDRLETILQINPAHGAGRDALWSQLVDMLAQSGPHLAPQSARRGLAALAMLRSQVPVETRVASAKSVGARCLFAPLISFLGNDDPAVVVALFDTVRLPSALWDIVLPDIGPLARSRLRRRGDIPVAVHRRLASFGTTDFALSGTTAPAPAALAPVGMAPATMLETTMASSRPTGSSIADLVQRIEAYRNRPAANDAGTAGLSGNQRDIAHSDEEAARFRCDADGNIRSISGLPRSIFVGLSLGQVARPVESGVDAGVARAFANRQAISGGRLLLVDAGPWSGDWLIKAAPLFDRETGRFLGYEGVIDHGHPAPVVEPDARAAEPRSDGMRQMVHELRSPLNAISGFAQLIEGQFFGPVSNRYRDLARSIIADATYLSGAFEDIDLAARLDSGGMARGNGMSDAAAMVAALSDSDSIVYAGPQSDVSVAVAERDLHQLLSRFLTLVAVSGGTEPCLAMIGLSDAAMPGLVTIEAQSEAVLRYSDGHDDSEGGALGAAFSWRLVDRMARDHGGSLRFIDDKALLNLPCARREEGRFGAGS